MQELQIDVYGRVQGVNFRNSLKSLADKIGLKGIVQNREDGNVLVIVQGEEEKLKELLFWIQGNPGFAKVEGLSYRFREVGKEYPDFRIIRESGYVVDRAKSVFNLGKSFIK